MGTRVGNWTVEICITSGTGPLVLSGTTPGFALFRNTVPSGPVWYSIEDKDNREAGIGTFDGVDTIVRTSVLATLVNGVFNGSNPSPISLSGQASVGCTFNASAYDELVAHMEQDVGNPHNVAADEVPYDPADDPTSDSLSVQGGMVDHGRSIEQRVASMSGVISGGMITEVSATQFTVTDGNGEVFDSYTSPGNTAIIETSWINLANITLQTQPGVNAGRTSMFITAAGSILQIPGPVTAVHYRENIFLGNVYYLNGAISAVANSPAIVKQTSTDLYDLFANNVQLEDSDVKPVTNQLQVYVEEGHLFYPGANWDNDRKNPNFLTVPAVGSEVLPVEFYPVTQDGSIAGPITTIPRAWNPTGNTVQQLTGNDATIHRLYSLGADDRAFLLLYGQNLYTTTKEAKDNILVDGDNTVFPEEIDKAYLVAMIGLNDNATDFDDIGKAWIVSNVLEAGGGDGDTGTVDHTTLLNRDVPDQHPILSITDLQDELDALLAGVLSRVLRTGDTMTGPLVVDLAGAPTASALMILGDVAQSEDVARVASKGGLPQIAFDEYGSAHFGQRANPADRNAGGVTINGAINILSPGVNNVSINLAGIVGQQDPLLRIAQTSGSATKLEVQPDTMLLLPRDPVTALEAATKQFVEARVSAKNLLVNGDFVVWQRQTSFTNIVGGHYVADMWRITNGGSALFQWSRQTVGDNNPVPTDTYMFGNCLTADPVVDATKFTSVIQDVEGVNVAPLSYGRASARPATLGFWTGHTKTGVYSVALRNAAQDRSYVIEYTQQGSGVWQYNEFIIPGDVTGDWLRGSGVGLNLSFSIAAGANFKTSTLEQWTPGNYTAGSNQVNAGGSTNDWTRLGGVSLHVGAHPAIVDTVDPATLLTQCQRHYEKSYSKGFFAGGIVADGMNQYRLRGLTNIGALPIYPVRWATAKHSVPSVKIYSPVTGAVGKAYNYLAAADMDANPAIIGDKGCRVDVSPAANTEINYAFHTVAEANL